MKAVDRKLTTDQFLLATVIDKMNLILWTKTKDAEKGRNMPKSIVEILEGKPQKSKAFDTREDFEEKREELLKKAKRGEIDG